MMRRPEGPRNQDEQPVESEFSRVYAALSSVRPAVYGGLTPPVHNPSARFNGLPSSNRNLKVRYY